jgi:hypothetical protein
MSTTASIFSKPKVPYTVLGGPPVERVRRTRPGLSVLLLSRGDRLYRQEKLEGLLEAGLEEITCVEGPAVSYELQPLSRQFPGVHFLVLQQEASPGERINLGIEEARSEFVLVFWSDQDPLEEGLRAVRRDPEALCLAPQLRGSGGELLPFIQVPVLIRGRLKLVPWKPVRDGLPTLFPFDYCGLYHRERFLRTGGYDSWMGNPYWQKLDFGLRCFLWGERLICRRELELRYSCDPCSEESSADESYKLFYLKNVAVRFDGEMGVLPPARSLPYIWKSGSGLVEALREFREVQRWVRENRYRFKSDLQSLVSHWEMPE